MRIHIVKSPAAPKAKVGDKKVIRGVEHVREFKRDPWGRLLRGSHGLREHWVPVAKGVQEKPAGVFKLN